MTQRRILIVLTLSAFATGCALQTIEPAEQDLPAAFENGTAAPAPQWPARDWFRDFGSDDLNNLIELAATNNWDIASARARVTQADARARQAGSGAGARRARANSLSPLRALARSNIR